jgi:hypothetical protein
VIARWEQQLLAQGASPAEVAAVVAALEQHMRETAPAPGRAAPAEPDRWLRAGRLAAVGDDADPVVRWGDPHPWR